MSRLDGVIRFLRSAQDVFAGDLTLHLRGWCSAAHRDRVLPAPSGDTDATGIEMAARLRLDPIACDGHGVCRTVPRAGHDPARHERGRAR